MKKILVSFSLLFLFVTVGSSQIGKDKTYDAGGMDGEVREVPDFNAVEVKAGINLHIHQADERKVEVRSKELSLTKIKTEVKKGVLYISVKRPILINFNHGTPRVDIWIDDLDAIVAKMGCDVYMEDQFLSEKLLIKGSMGSDLHLNLGVRKLEGSSSGGSDLHLSGYADEMVLRSKLGSDIKAYKLDAKRGEVRSTGGSSAFINVSDEVSLSAGGGSDIHVKGNPKVTHQNSSGGSDIHISKKPETL